MSKSIKLKNNVYLDAKSVHGEIHSIGTRLLYYGSHLFQKNLWNDLVSMYYLVDGWGNVRTGYERWFRFSAWVNDNVAGGTGLVVGLFDQNGNYVMPISFGAVWGSGQNERGNYKTSDFIDYNSLNIGWGTFKTIIMGSSNGTQGYLFSLMIDAYDIPSGINPNNL